MSRSSTKYVAASDKGFSSHKVNNVPNVHWLGADFTTKVQYSREIGSELIDISRESLRNHIGGEDIGRAYRNIEGFRRNLDGLNLYLYKETKKHHQRRKTIRTKSKINGSHEIVAKGLLERGDMEVVDSCAKLSFKI